MKELEDYFYLIWLLLKSSALDLRTMVTPFQHLSEAFCWNQVIDNILYLPPHAQQFELVFTKEDFDTLLDYCKWDHTIKLVPGAELKLLEGC